MILLDSTINGCVWISTFSPLVCVLVSITSSVLGIKIFIINAEI